MKRYALAHFVLLSLLALFAPLRASAVTATLEWGKPAGDVSGYNIYVAADVPALNVLLAAHTPSIKGAALAGADTLRYVGDFPAGPAAITVTSWFCDDSGCGESVAGPIWTGTIAAPVVTPPVTPTPAPVTPAPPTSLKVTVATAFDLTKAKNKLSLVALGSVPLGTACDASQGALVGGRQVYLVARERVVKGSVLTVLPLTTFAECGPGG